MKPLDRKTDQQRLELAAIERGWNVRRLAGGSLLLEQQRRFCVVQISVRLTPAQRFSIACREITGKAGRTFLRTMDDVIADLDFYREAR